MAWKIFVQIPALTPISSGILSSDLPSVSLNFLSLCKVLHVPQLPLGILPNLGPANLCSLISHNSFGLQITDEQSLKSQRHILFTC